MPITLVVPMSLHKGWIESSPYFCIVSETGRDVAEHCADTLVGSLAPHKFVKLTEVNTEFADLPKIDILENQFKYMDDYIALAIPRIRDQLQHIANAVMTGIHDVFPPEKDDDKYATPLKEFLKEEGAWEVIRNVLGFYFDGKPGEYTIWITEYHRTNILSRLKKWIR